MKSNLDLGIQPTHPLNEDGSQTINLTEYNKRYGIHDTQNIKVYVIDPADNTEKPVAKWEAPLKSLNSSHENRRGFLTFGTSAGASQRSAKATRGPIPRLWSGLTRSSRPT